MVRRKGITTNASAIVSILSISMALVALSSCRTPGTTTATTKEVAIERPMQVTSHWQRVLECREKVWPGVPFGSSTTAFVFSLNEDVHLWRNGWQEATSDQILHIREYHEGLYSAIASELTGGHPLLTIEASPKHIEAHMNSLESFVTSRLTRCLGVKHHDEAWSAYVQYQTSTPGVVGLTFHEYLHAFSQSHWAYNRLEHVANGDDSSEGDRLEARKYTLAIESLLYDALTDEVQTRSREKIAQVLLLSYRFEAIAPDIFREFGALTIQEGSAFYAELIAAQLATDSCSTPNDDIRGSVLNKLGSLRKIVIALGLEGYLIGSYVGLLLDRHGIVDWPKLVEDETTSMLRLLGTLYVPNINFEDNAEEIKLSSDLANCLAEN